MIFNQSGGGATSEYIAESGTFTGNNAYSVDVPTKLSKIIGLIVFDDFTTSHSGLWSLAYPFRISGYGKVTACINYTDSTVQPGSAPEISSNVLTIKSAPKLYKGLTYTYILIGTK